LRGKEEGKLKKKQNYWRKGQKSTLNRPLGGKTKGGHPTTPLSTPEKRKGDPEPFKRK